MSFLNPFPPASRVNILLLLLLFVPLAVASAAAGTPEGPINSAAEVASKGVTPKIDSRITALLDDLVRVRNLYQAALSPDGRQIAWVVASPAGGTQIELASVSAPNAVRQVSAAARSGSCNEGDVAWAPDGGQMAFLSDCNPSGQMQIFLSSASAFEAARQVGQLHGLAESLQWSLDGKSLGFLYVEGATRRPGALDPMKPPSGVIEEDGVEVQRVARVDVHTGHLELLTSATLHVYEFDWSPDSKQIAFIAAAPPGENNWWVAKLYAQAISGEPVGTATAEPSAILDPNLADSALHGLQIAVPRWSPDGKQIAFIGGLMSDQGVTGGDIYTLAAEGGKPHLVSPDINPNVSITWISWHGSDNIAFTYIAGGSVGYGNVQPRNNAADAEVNFLVPASIGDGLLTMSLSFAKDGEVAFISSSYSQAPEVWVGRFSGDGIHNRLEPVTHYNDGLKPFWGKAESISWKSDNFNVQGWLLYPLHYDATKKYPMVVSVHGGPAATQLPRWPALGFDATAFSALDYFVFFPNPRGSYGQGEAFTMANRKDFGYGDLHDIVAGVDAVVAKYPVDGTRVGLTGWSYGGFMTMFAVTQTGRFRAAVAGAGISDWQSYYGENAIDQWMIPYFGASVYDDPGAYAKSSAIRFIRQAKTPTLVVVGDRDGECPAPQSFEFWHALRAQHVPTRLVVYRDEGHRFLSFEHRRDVLERALEWFERYMPPQP